MAHKFNTRKRLKPKNYNYYFITLQFNHNNIQFMKYSIFNTMLTKSIVFLVFVSIDTELQCENKVGL